MPHMRSILALAARLISDLLRAGWPALRLLQKIGVHRWVVRVCSILVIGLALSNALLPAVARAQLAAQPGASITQILAALVGQTVTAERFVATASSGSGFACSSVLSSCVDLGPGASNSIGTNVGGDILLGGGSTSTIARIGDATLLQNGQIILTNGALTLDGSTFIRNQSAAVLITDTDGVNINSTSAVTGILLDTEAIDVTNITANTCKDQTVTIAGVNANDKVFVTPNFSPSANVIIGNARVTNAGTDEVTFRLCNVATADEDPASGDYLFFVIRP
jgi:hypothetical protein